MTKSTSNNNLQPPAFELKGSLFTLTVLLLRRTELALLDQQLSAKINQAPGFFQNAPVVIDLAELSETSQLDFSALSALLQARGMVPVGIRNGPEQLQHAARLAGLPKLPENRPIRRSEPEEDSEKSSSAEKSSPAESVAAPSGIVKTRSRIVTQPIRSGQQVYAPQGDLIILGAVSNGAEVLADGHIHVYGPLRGRALAGVKGDDRARIFCNSLEAQLISVAGNYRILDEPNEADKNKAVQIFLVNDKLVIESLSR